MKTFSVAIACGATFASVASAQLGDFNGRPGPHGVYAIRNVRIVPVVGAVIEHGNVVIGADGKITAVGANAVIPNNTQTLDGTNLTVYPGMMEAGTTMGLNEIPDGVVQLNDASEVGSFNPNVHAFYGFNSHSNHIGVTRVVGITHIVSHPTGGILSGQAALMNLAGDTPPQMAVERDVVMMLSMPRGGGAGFGRGGGGGGGGAGAGAGGGRGNAGAAAAPAAMSPLDSLRALLTDAATYATAQEAYAKDKTLPRPSRDVVLDALVPVVRGRMPVMVPADAANDIRDAISFADANHFKLIILGGRQALQVADQLKQHNVGVVLTSVLALPPGEDDPYDINYSMPAKLAAAGVHFAIAGGQDPGDERNLPYVAGMAAAYGLSKEDALKSVTLWPAEIFGVSSKLGSIEVGKMANLVVTTGDILEAKTDTKALFINGQPVPLSSKHTYMFEMFKDRP